jgi:putative ABC transport system substrate-binding protein
MAIDIGRRRFISALSGVAAVWPLGARAQQQANIPRVGYLFSFVQQEAPELWEACRQGMRDLGYVEGKSIILEARWAEGHDERLLELAVQLVQSKADVIVSAATQASLAAKAVTDTIPIVIVGVADPIKSGLVASLARPGGNVTGLSLLTSDLSGKRLELITELVPNVSHVAILMNPSNPASAVCLAQTQVAARQSKVQLESVEARSAIDISEAFVTIAQRHVEALIVFDDPMLWSYRAEIVAQAAAQRLPAMYGFKNFVDDGGLVSYGPDRPRQYRKTAIYVDKILKGAKPADLPVEQPVKFELVVNRKTANSLGLTLPQSVLAFADEVIE